MKTYTSKYIIHCDCGCEQVIFIGEGFTRERGGNTYKISHKPKDRSDAAREDTKEIVPA
jgi:hypothetical protein